MLGKHIDTKVFGEEDDVKTVVFGDYLRRVRAGNWHEKTVLFDRPIIEMCPSLSSALICTYGKKTSGPAGV